ncbi:MAG: class I SAM-dependent methyltransferase [Proteobacteria bacterium]|nr:class I SAM-dependent methyltransferase [Pseudomonadota bacterium]
MSLKRDLRRFNRRAGRFALDAVDLVLGRRQPLVPPRWLSHNSATFEAADEIVELVDRYVGLKPNAAVLDLGCGIGRVAYGLTKVLGPDAQYVGIDIVERAINWMQREYAPRHPNYKFHHLDVHSSAYNPKGRKQTEQVDFGFLGEQKFDVVILVSLFTHLHPDHVRHYLKLIHDVLKPDGRLFASVFINDDFAKAQYQKQKETGVKLTSRNFRFKGDGFYAAKDGNPEFIAAYDPEQIKDMWADSKMELEPFRYGTWCGRSGGHNFYQDVTISRAI